MKIFICGYKGLKTITDSARTRLQDLSEQGHAFLSRKLEHSDEIIQTYLADIGCKNVTIYSMKDNHDDVREEWSSKKVNSRDQHEVRNPYYHFDDRDSVMADDAEAGFIFWDKKDVMTFLNIVNLLLMGKPVDISLDDENAVCKMDSIEAFRALLPERTPAYTTAWDTLPEDLYRDAVMSIDGSDVFTQSLLDNPVSKYSILNLILESPRTIQEKACALHDLSVTDDLFNELLDSLADEMDRKKRGVITNCPNPVESVYHSLSSNTCIGHYEDLCAAIDELDLKPGEYFYLKRGNSYGNIEGIAAFTDLDSALKYIRQYTRKWSVNSNSFLILEKWHRNEDSGDGRLTNNYTYYLDRDRIVDVSKNSMRYDGMTSFGHSYLMHRVLGMGVFMNFPTPFEVGDIVMMNSTPFGEIGFAIVLEKAGAEGFSQGLHIRVLYYNHGWKITWLDSWKGSTDCNMPHLSPLYRIAKYEDELPSEYELYRTIQNLISGDENKAKEILDALLDEEDEYFPDFEEKEFLKIMNDKVQGFSVPVNRDDEIIVAEYSKQHFIRFSDLHEDRREMWPYEWEETDIRIVREEDNEILLALQTKDGRDGRLIAWGKTYDEVFLASKAVGCIYMTGSEGWHVALCEETDSDGNRILTVRYFGGQLMPWCKAPVLCREEDFKIGQWNEAHLEVDGNELFLVLDGKKHLYSKDLRYHKQKEEFDDLEDDETEE